MMRRKSNHGLGQYSIPGGVEPSNLQTFRKEGIHVISLIFHTRHYSGNPEIKEIDKHESL